MVTNMLFPYDDRHAIAAGRYLRAARFPVIDPKITLLSYRNLLALEAEKLGILSSKEMRAFREMLHRTLCYMLTLPASSTFHHRTMGGLFYHSLEVGSAAAQAMKAKEGASDGMVLAAAVAGFLHDIGKVLTFFHVYPLLAPHQDLGFGSIDEPIIGTERWDPMQSSLWDWCQDVGATHLSLKYHGGADLGHEAAGRSFWRHCITNEVVDAIALRDTEAYATLEELLDGKNFSQALWMSVKHGDRVSQSRDINPTYRWEPKRSDLHAIRRFVEFAWLSPWNCPGAPFVMADVWVDGRDTGLCLPFFRTRADGMDVFRNYLFREDLYGATYKDHAKSSVLWGILEQHDVLRNTLPGGLITQLEPAWAKHNPSFAGRVQFAGETESEARKEPLSYFPMGARRLWFDMPLVRLLL